VLSKNETYHHYSLPFTVDYPQKIALRPSLASRDFHR
jgi:hypothetical protein